VHYVVPVMQIIFNGNGMVSTRTISPESFDAVNNVIYRETGLRLGCLAIARGFHSATWRKET
jgi:hypothetical protein